MVLWSTYPRYYPAPYVAPVEAVSSASTAEDLSAQITAQLEAVGVTASAEDLSASIVATVEAVGVQTVAEVLSASITATVEAVGVTATAEDLSVPPVYIRLTGFKATRAADFLSTTIEWDAVSAATEYVIYRAPSIREAFTELARVDPPATSHTDNHGDAETDFVYLVAAVSWTLDEGPTSPAGYTFGTLTAKE